MLLLSIRHSTHLKMWLVGRGNYVKNIFYFLFACYFLTSNPVDLFHKKQPVFKFHPSPLLLRNIFFLIRRTVIKIRRRRPKILPISRTFSTRAPRPGCQTIINFNLNSPYLGKIQSEARTKFKSNLRKYLGFKSFLERIWLESRIKNSPEDK